ncbi:hypothetical protein [Gordoniibacillus kamchatkensis]|nr:hypothetical protein [Paenibacillus sp. VKM B-2647]
MMKREPKQDTENKMTNANKKRALLAGGSVKTKHNIDAQAICRQVRGKE